MSSKKKEAQKPKLRELFESMHVHVSIEDALPKFVELSSDRSNRSFSIFPRYDEVRSHYLLPKKRVLVGYQISYIRHIFVKECHHHE